MMHNAVILKPKLHEGKYPHGGEELSLQNQQSFSCYRHHFHTIIVLDDSYHMQTRVCADRLSPVSHTI